MNDAPHEKVKNKEQPSNAEDCFNNVLKLGFVISIIGIILMVGFYIGLTVMLRPAPFAPNNDDVIKTCSILDLSPESAFCSHSDQRTIQDLKTLIEQTYPPGSITLTELRSRFSVDLQCYTQPLTGNLPYCLVHLPITGAMLYIEHDKKDHVVDYGVVDWEGSLHR
jgi:hypothetical protein